jgi:hypothetical protein
VSEPERLYRVVEYIHGNLFPASNYYKTIAKARERRTRMLNARRDWYGTIFDPVTKTRIPDPQYKPSIYGIQVCEPEWRGIE